MDISHTITIAPKDAWTWSTTVAEAVDRLSDTLDDEQKRLIRALFTEMGMWDRRASIWSAKAHFPYFTVRRSTQKGIFGRFRRFQ